MYSQMKEYQSTKRFANDTLYLANLDTKQLLQRNDELLRRLTGAREELKKFKVVMDVFRSWMENAQKKLIEKEKYLTNFDKIDNCFESTTIFVSDVIEHQADLNLMTNSAKNFIDLFKSYLSYSKEYRTIPPRKRARIESISNMEDELSDIVAANVSEFRKLLFRVHMLLSNELSGLSIKQTKYKEAVSAAGIWLKGAERRTNEVLSEPVTTEVKALKIQLNQTLAMNDEFVSHGNLISDAKNVLKTLLRSLEGQLSHDEMADVKNPVIDIENKYDYLLKSLDERCQKLDIVLISFRSRQFENVSNSLHMKSVESIGEQNTECVQNDMEEEIRGEVERSINGQHIKFNTECTLLKTIKESSRNGFEKEIGSGSETPICYKANIESSPEFRSDELEEGECVSPVEFSRKDLKDKIDGGSGTPVNKSNNELSTMLCALLKATEEIFKDSSLKDENDQNEEIQLEKSINGHPNAVSSKNTLLEGIDEISEDSFSDDKNGGEEKNNIMPETQTSADKTTTGPELNLPEARDGVLQNIMEPKKSANSGIAICEKMDIEFISDPECFSFEGGDEILADDSLDKSNSKPRTPARELKIVAYSECNSFEDTKVLDESNLGTETLMSEPKISTIPERYSFQATNKYECARDNLEAYENSLEEQTNIAPETSTSELKLADFSPDNTSSKARNDCLDEEISSKPRIMTCKQKGLAGPKRTSLETKDEFFRYDSGKIDSGLETETLTNERNASPSSEHVSLETKDEFSGKESSREIGSTSQTATNEEKMSSSPEYIFLKPTDECTQNDLKEMNSRLESESYTKLIAEAVPSSQLDAPDDSKQSRKDSSELNLFVDTAPRSQPEVKDSIKENGEHPSEPNLSINTTLTCESKVNHDTGKSREFLSDPNTIVSRAIDDLLKEHLLTRQPVILLCDVSKSLMTEKVRQQTLGSSKYNLKSTKSKSYELLLSTSKKDDVQKAESRSQKKKPFKMDFKKHPVSLLEEYCTYYNLLLPRYKFEKTKDSAKNTSFMASVVVKNEEYTARVSFLSKKQSKIEVAKLCLQDLGLLPKR